MPTTQMSNSQIKKSKKEESFFVCTICNQSMKSKIRYNHHIKRHEATHKCFDCNKTFKKKKILKCHLLSKRHLHKISELSKAASTDDKVTSTNPPVKPKIYRGPKRVFKCPICDKEFKNEESFNGHQNVHLGIKPVPCSDCKKCFISKHALTKHISRVHKQKNAFICSICNKGFSGKNSLSYHMLLHTGVVKPHQCAECGSCFRRKSQLELHSRTHAILKDFLCMRCGKQFNTKQLVVDHESMHDGGDFKCSICKMQFKNPWSLSIHKRKIHFQKKIEERGEHDVSNKSSSLTKYSSTVGNSFGCSFCGKYLSSKMSLINHERIHKNEKPYSCTLCKARFRVKYSLQNHLFSVHQGKRNFRNAGFTCTFCNKTFISKQSLRDHLNIHEGVRPYKCELCGKGFTQKTHLRTHSKVHKGEKSFACSNCDKTFSTKGNLSQHEDTHNTSSRRFPCKICNKTFLFISRLKKHLKVHSTV